MTMKLSDLRDRFAAPSPSDGAGWWSGTVFASEICKS